MLAAGFCRLYLITFSMGKAAALGALGQMKGCSKTHTFSPLAWRGGEGARRVPLDGWPRRWRLARGNGTGLLEVEARAKKKPHRAAFWGIDEGLASGGPEPFDRAVIPAVAANVIWDLAAVVDELFQCDWAGRDYLTGYGVRQIHQPRLRHLLTFRFCHYLAAEINQGGYRVASIDHCAQWFGFAFERFVMHALIEQHAVTESQRLASGFKPSTITQQLFKAVLAVESVYRSNLAVQVEAGLCHLADQLMMQLLPGADRPLQRLCVALELNTPLDLSVDFALVSACPGLPAEPHPAPLGLLVLVAQLPGLLAVRLDAQIQAVAMVYPSCCKNSRGYTLGYREGDL